MYTGGAMRLFRRQPSNHQVLMRLQEIEEELIALKAAHERLRGRFYATRGQGSPPLDLPKAEILRRHRAGLPIYPTAEAQTP